jgi:hypothetical protein
MSASQTGGLTERLATAGSPAAQARRRLLGIAPAEASFARRGFRPIEPSRQRRLEAIGRTFVAGYNAALRIGDPDAPAPALDAPSELRGFAFEGAGMAFALLDILSPWRARRFARFVAGPAASHVYMAHVGAGWALARTSRHLAWRLGPLDPLLRWLMLDGHGFHAGYFYHRAAIDRRRRPHGLRGGRENVFDQGLGRALWFVRGADVATVAATVAAFPPERRADLWSGVGLAAAYAGGVEDGDLAALAAAGGEHRLELGQGAAFAAKARERAGNPAAHTDRACRIFCGLAAGEAAAITDQALDRLDPADGGAYARWRAEIRRLLRVSGSPLPRGVITTRSKWRGSDLLS